MTYERYQELGGTLPAAKFELYKSLSEYYISTLTRGEKLDAKVAEACMMLLIGAYEQSDSLRSSGSTSSYSNDGVSVSYQQYNNPDSILVLAMDRVAMLLANAGVRRRSLAVRHRE